MNMKIKVRSWLAVEVAVMFGLAMTTDAVAQQPKAAAPASAIAATAPVAKDDAQGPGRHEGVTVHGHWVINVLDAKGTVVQHRDFENALMTSGQTVLTSLLIGSLTPGYLQIAAYQGAGNIFAGFIDESSSVEDNNCNYAPTHICNPNLVVTPVTVTDPSPPGSVYSHYSGLTLSGSLQAQSNVSIDGVQTRAFMCRVAGLTGTTPTTTRTSIAPTSCPATLTPPRDGSAGPSGYFVLTGTTITPLAVQTGQTVQITVILSFS